MQCDEQTTIALRTESDPAFAVLFSATVCLVGARVIGDLVPNTLAEYPRMMWWAATQILFYGIVPLIVWTVVLRRSPQEIGLRVRETASHAWIYGAMFAFGAPFVLVASATSEFQSRYPLPFTPAGSDPWPELWLWWAIYAVQFVAVELFFRGFLVLGLAPRLGSLAIPVMVIPYTMIHFVKPPAEVMAAVVGGFVMGILAYRTRSIWWGVALHCAIAAVMDVASLWHKDVLW